MNVLVIGGSGFIGRRVVRRLLEEGQTPVVMDINTGGSFPKDIASQVKVVTGDMTKISNIARAIRDFRIDRMVVTGYLLLPVSEEALYSSIEVNVLGITNVFEAARLFGIKRVVFTSSVSVYGAAEYYGEREATEEERLLPPPYILYCATKRFNEYVASKYEQLYGVEIPALRVTAVVGAGRKMGFTSWPSELVSNALQKKPTFVPLRSDHILNWIYVSDVAELVVRLCLAEKLRYRVYNTGGVIARAGELVEMVRKYIPDTVAEFAAKPYELPLVVYRINNSKAREEFNWREMDLATMVQALIDDTQRLMAGS